VIAGVPVRGIADIMTTDGTVIDVKTSSRKPSGVAADHALQLATYSELLPGASGATRIDALVSTKDPQLVQIEHTPGEAGRRLVDRIYPLVAEGIAGGLYVPNRNSTMCSRRYCAFADVCEREFGGCVE
jgi:CRISPR/Cas system-associated exonuclease Cas4 (RecB family)